MLLQIHILQQLSSSLLSGDNAAEGEDFNGRIKLFLLNLIFVSRQVLSARQEIVNLMHADDDRRVAR